MPEYTITLQDIKNYLASKQEDEVIGEPMNGAACLAHNTLVHKYELEPDDVLALSTSFHIAGKNFDYTPDVEGVVYKFDWLHCSSVKKSILRERIPQLFEGEPNA